MAKRVKRAQKSIFSIKKEIEEHFRKLERDIEENNLDRGRYHFKELNSGFIPSLERKFKILGKSDDSIEEYKKRLMRLREKVGL